ncbi:hypothetical protein C440_04338 [Haloferax mucosum ATCC BAA-1512]|uniref:DUF8163 domain-containing protein n=1 Tax=Haloferax mucosum ATCC BAA-1512 TaxID=662479 RepID=M0IJP7_9EURY|nr:hypothetical protein [Haloferax mucosum]ELZ96975.1 hypothetical protein C440_04338 [Haloferax mucosum ATCC BAA-1512]
METTQNQRIPTIRAVLESNELTPADAVGVFLLTAALTTTSGLWGVVAGLSVLGVALVATGPATFVLAQLWAVSLLSGETAFPVAAAQVATLPLLVSATCSWPPDRTRLGRLTAAYVVAGGGVWLLWTGLRWPWQSAFVFVTLAAFVSYALHRYELVAVGAVTPDPEADR